LLPRLPTGSLQRAWRVVCLSGSRRADRLPQQLCFPHSDLLAPHRASALRQNVTPAKSSGSKFSPRFADDEQQVYNARNTATMAKSKMVTRKQAATAEAPLTTKVANGTPYQLDPTQVERAAKALVSHMKKHAEEKDDKEAVKNLADDEDEAENKDQPIFLSVSTKKHVSNTNSLKPTKMSVQTFHLAQPLY
jgi:hypothetical protein